MKPSVSVHIVTYNSAGHVRDCLESVFRQTFPIKQIVVIDNASQDETRRILGEYGDRVEVVLFDRNIGFAAAHNQGIRMTNADYCLVLNPDVVLHPDYIKHLVESMENDKTAGSSTGCLLRKSDPRFVDSAGLTINKARRAFDRGSGESADRWTKKEEVFGVSAAAALYSRRMIDDVSLNGEFFDCDFFVYKEDVDVAWRARWRGWSALYVPAAIAYHERGWKAGERQRQPLVVRRYSYINRYRMIVKNDHPAYLLFHLPFLLGYEAAALVYLLFREPGVLRAWSDFWRDWPNLWKKRQQIRCSRRVRPADLYRFFE